METELIASQATQAQPAITRTHRRQILQTADAEATSGVVAAFTTAAARPTMPRAIHGNISRMPICTLQFKLYISNPAATAQAQFVNARGRTSARTIGNARIGSGSLIVSSTG